MCNFQSILPTGFRLPVLVALLYWGLPNAAPAGDSPAAPAAQTPIDYVKQVKPLLEARCYSCHGALRQRGGLRLDAGVLILKGGDSGPAVLARNSGESLLVDAVTTGTQVSRMPQEGEPLKPDEVAVLKGWIDQGASYPSEEKIPADPARHWAFVPPRRPAVPVHRADLATVAATASVGNPIDAFLGAAQREQNVHVLPRADKFTLLRRVYLDLIGLPPTPTQLQAFLDDASPGAYRRVVRQLLEDPRYGERWGRHWMDVWRYSDWAGYRAEVRNSQKHIWHWRDYIIESLNQDRPYDRMIQDMLAADELTPADPFAVSATGFLARNWFKFNRNTWLENTVEHTGKAFLGLTLNCARCHDHMYDPISQKDYFRFRAFFETHDIRTDTVAGQASVEMDGIPRAYDGRLGDVTYLFERGDERKPDKSQSLTPAIPELFGVAADIRPTPLPAEAYYPGLRAHVQEEALRGAKAAVEATQKSLDAAAVSPRADEEVAPFQPPQQTLAPSTLELAAAKHAVAQAQLANVMAVIAADVARFGEQPAPNAEQLAQAAHASERLLAAAQAQESHLLAVGALAEAEQKQVVGADGKEPATVSEARKKLAAAEKAVATANTAVEQPAGVTYRGLSSVFPSTSTGRRTALAAWITSRENPLTARVAVNHIWMRHFGQPLVASVFDFGLHGSVPRHPCLLDWLAVEFMESGWRMKQLHELILTSDAYCRSGLSARHPEGNRNQPIDPDNQLLWQFPSRRLEGELIRDSVLAVAEMLDPAMGGPEIEQNLGQVSPRRSVYFRHAHEKHMEFLKLYDAANTNECYRREESIIPQQALAQANNVLTREATRTTAAILARGLGPAASEEDFIVAAFERVLLRRPTDDERQACAAYLSRQAALLSNMEELTPFAAGSTAKRQASADPRQRAQESLVHVLFNHHEFVTIR